jgi:hypothetical protein
MHVALRPGTRLGDPGDQDGRIAVADAGNHRIVLTFNFRFQVFSPSRLRLTDLVAGPTGDVPSGQSVSVTGTVVNEGPTSLTVSVQATVKIDDQVTTPGPGELTLPEPLVVPAGGSAPFTFSLITNHVGSLTFDVSATATTSTGVIMSGWEISTADTSGLVRSERSGPGTGRLYQLAYVGADAAGNMTSCIDVLAQVPHDQGKKK